MNNENKHTTRDLYTPIVKPNQIPGSEKQKADYLRFVEYMNEKAIKIGMTSSEFNDAAGMHNVSTARDLLRLTIYAKRYSILDGIWQLDTYMSKVMGPTTRTRESISKSNHSDLNDYYEVLGRKGGTLRSTSKNLFVYNLVSVIKIPNSKDQMVVVVMYAYGDNDTLENRFRATRQVADIAIAKYNGQNISSCDLEICCENAIAAVIPSDEASYDKARILYEKNADMPGRPMSVSKILTALCVLDNVKNLDQTIKFHVFDTNIGGFYIKDYFVDDEISYKDALHVLMLESSNVTAQALGRSVGELLNDSDPHKMI